jgi:RNA polymerase sigma-70 factor (sigma-E family)
LAVDGNLLDLWRIFMSMGSRTEELTPTRDEVVELLWRSHHARLIRLAVGLTGDRTAAEEIVQDAFAALLRRWWHLRDSSAAMAYLQRVVVNGARKQRIRSRLYSHATGASVEAEQSPGWDVESRTDMFAALSRLPYRKRACLVLRYYEDLSEAQVADLLGISIGTVKSQCSRGLRQLEVALQATRKK